MKKVLSPCQITTDQSWLPDDKNCPEWETAAWLSWKRVMLSYIPIVMTWDHNLIWSLLWHTVSLHGANLWIMLRCLFLRSVIRTMMGVYRGTRIPVILQQQRRTGESSVFLQLQTFLLCLSALCKWLNFMVHPQQRSCTCNIVCPQGKSP